MIVYHLEILNPIPPIRGELMPGIRYCKGRDDYAGMGFAVVCAYDYCESRYRIFCQDNSADLKALIDSREVIAGFGSYALGDRVLKAAGIEWDPKQSYDLQAEIWRGMNLHPDTFDIRTHGGYGLEVLCAANFPPAVYRSLAEPDGKAWLRWQSGNVGSVIEGCLRQVWQIKSLIERVMVTSLKNPKQPGKFLKVRSPGEKVKPEILVAV